MFTVLELANDFIPSRFRLGSSNSLARKLADKEAVELVIKNELQTTRQLREKSVQRLDAVCWATRRVSGL